MIYFLFGQDARASRKVFDKFIARFSKEVPHAWTFIDFEKEEDQESVLDKLSPSLFAKKIYAVIKDASRLEDEAALLEIARPWAEDDSVVVFYESGPLPKGKLFTFLQKHAKTEEFSYKSSEEIKRFVAGEIKKSEAHIEAIEKRRLENLYQENPDLFYQEFEKILLGGTLNSPKNRIEDRELFNLGDAWGMRDSRRALSLYERLIQAGFEPDAILRTLMWHVKNVCLAGRGYTKDMKPFVARKAESQAKRFSPEELERAYIELLNASDFRKKENLETRLLSFLLRG